MTNITFTETNLKIDNIELILQYPILDSFESNKLIIVFLDPDENMGRDGQYKNLMAYNLFGEKIWVAELPTPEKSDVYWKITNKNPLVVNSFSSYECEIDISNGKILNRKFYK